MYLKSRVFWYNFDVCNWGEVEKIFKSSLDSIPSPSTSVEIQIMDRKVCLRCKGKILLGVVSKHLKTKSCWHHPAMFCLITPSKLSLPQFEFSLKGKVMGLNPGFLHLFYFTLRNCTEVWFASFQASGFITAIVENQV